MRYSVYHSLSRHWTLALILVVVTTAVAWTSPASQGAQYAISLLGWDPLIDTSSSENVFVEYTYSVKVSGIGSTSLAWILTRQDGHGIWSSIDVASQGTEEVVHQRIPGNLPPGHHEVEILLFHESVPLPSEDRRFGTVPPGWTPKARDSSAIDVDPFAFPEGTEAIWIGTLPFGCDVYAAPLHEVVDANGDIDIRLLRTHYIGHGPVTMDAAPGEYAVAIEMELAEEQGILLDEADVRYALTRNGRRTGIGRVYTLTKEWLKLGVVIGLFQPEGFEVSELDWLYPSEHSFAILPIAVKNILSDARQAGYAVPEWQIPVIIQLLERGGKVIWSSPWTQDKRRILVITKLAEGYDINRLLLSRE